MDVERHGDRETKVRDDMSKSRKTGDAPIVDHAGHIQLFAPKQVTQTEKNAEAEAERKRKEQELEDQYTMRFANAAGFKKGVKDPPWYTASQGYTGTESLEDPDKFVETVGTNVFRREDPGRHRRDTARMTQSDPMAMMKQAQSKLKEANRRKDQTNKEREHQLQMLKAEQEREEKREKRRHDRDRDVDDLEGFSLNARKPTSKDKHERRHHHRHESNSRNRSRHEHRHSEHERRSAGPSREKHDAFRPSRAQMVG